MRVAQVGQCAGGWFPNDELKMLFTVGLPSCSVVVPCVEITGRDARRAMVRVLPTSSSFLWAVEHTERPCGI